jgi:uncharacterized protein HemX
MAPMTAATDAAPRTINTNTAVSLGVLVAIIGSLAGAAITWGRSSAELAYTQEQVRELRQESKAAAEESRARGEQLAELVAEIRALRADSARTIAAVERLEAKWERVPTPPRSTRYARDVP